MFKFFADEAIERIPVDYGRDGGRPSPWEKPGPRPGEIIFNPIVIRPISGIIIKDPGSGKVTP